MSASQTKTQPQRKTQGASKSAAKSQPKPKPKPQPMGPSGYRLKFGSSDQLVMAAVREQWPTITFGDDDILGAVGWAITPKTAIAKVRALLES